MVSKKIKLLQPNWLKEFRCIGPACEDSCCGGWQVNIDRATYKKYRNCSDRSLKERMREKILRNRSNVTDDTYAKILLNQDGSCPFHNEKGLCDIQLNLGEQYLSNVCATYPRLTTVVNDGFEKSLTLSCPEAARIMLKNPAAMEFDETEETVSTINIVGRFLSTNHVGCLDKPQKHFWELRIFTISLLQNRRYPLWKRLAILGLFYNKLEQLIQEDKVQVIPQLLEDYRGLVEDGSIGVQLDTIPNQVTLQMRLMKEIADERFLKGVNNKRYKECFFEALDGICYSPMATIEELGERYVQAYHEYYKPFMDEHEYMLENCLVNYVFEKLFPFSDNEQIFDNYVMLVVHYALIKMLLIGMAGFHKKEFNEELVVKLVQSFYHTIEHDKSFLQHIFNLIEKNNYNTMAYMAILIKN